MLRKAPIIIFIAAILAMGAMRFALTLNGAPNSAVRFASMSVVILIGVIYFALKTDIRKERLKAAYLLILPYMIVEVAALAYTWRSGVDTIFHAPEYSLGSTIGVHTIGHFVGGLTWEPFILFGLMEIVWRVKLRRESARALRGVASR